MATLGYLETKPLIQFWHWITILLQVIFMLGFNWPALQAAARANSGTILQLKKLVAIRHLIQRILRDSRIIKIKFKGVSRDVRKALFYLNVKAKHNLAKEKDDRDRNEEEYEDDIIEEKEKLSQKALDAVTEVITTLQEEKEYNPVTILGIAMSDEIINSLFSVLGVCGFACLNAGLGLDNPF